ncbi:homocysteine S-methyltransferase [Exiguobacterium artemiae]|uniref:homocysteine S-methyltransferase n=1 Tax=Exiguobacterium artemiae TaxID=340145 RepID=UPI002964CD38|nr:homocysteine S-methyltransferase [Exiguobacterium sibiricum]MDW2885180.1 homocysteine S-methyltransferase [Exiguobacterium sibiricum]
MSKNNNPVEQLLKKQLYILLDGALATELERHGSNLDDPLWSARVLLEEPEQIHRIHTDYFKIGADCAITASYQASVTGFGSRGIKEDEAVELIKQTVYLAQQARAETGQAAAHALIAGSIGPYGAYLSDGSEYVGHYGVDDAQLEAFHRPRIEALIEAGADVLAFETIPSLQEAKVLFRLLEEFPEQSAWLAFSLRDATHISEGTPLSECMEALGDHPQLAAVGANCFPASIATDFITALKQLTDVPIIVYPNSGEQYDPVSKTWSGEAVCTAFEDIAPEWYAAGARLIGGCCRTTPEQIERIQQKVTIS